MPVTSRNLLVHKFSGVGKKPPTNLAYDTAKQQVINTNCDCLIPATVPIPEPRRVSEKVHISQLYPISKAVAIFNTDSKPNIESKQNTVHISQLYPISKTVAVFKTDTVAKPVATPKPVAIANPDPIVNLLPIPKPGVVFRTDRIVKQVPTIKTYRISNRKLGDAICDGASCYLSDYDYVTGPQFNAISGTNFTLTNFEGIIFIVNPSKNIVYCDDGVGFPFIIDVEALHISLIKADNRGITYTFSS
jgi:hypothetical protein